MASSQCSKPAEKPCNQGQQNHSPAEMVYELAFRARGRKNAHNGQTTANSQTQCHGQKQAEGGIFKTGTQRPNRKFWGGTNNDVTPACSAKNNRTGERKKGLPQKIKDGVSGHSDGSSSSSESDNDDEKCGEGRIEGQLLKTKSNIA